MLSTSLKGRDVAAAQTGSLRQRWSNLSWAHTIRGGAFVGLVSQNQPRPLNHVPTMRSCRGM